MFDPNNPCLFCNSKQSGLAAENELAYASYDTYPVSEFHFLIIPKRHVKDYFDLNDDEVIACNNLIKQIKEEILLKDPSVKGFNIGSNAGSSFWAINFTLPYSCNSYEEKVMLKIHKAV